MKSNRQIQSLNKNAPFVISFCNVRLLIVFILFRDLHIIH